MNSFEILVDIFTYLSVFDSPKGSSNTVKTRKKYQPVFQKKAPNNIQIHQIILTDPLNPKKFKTTVDLSYEKAKIKVFYR